MAFFNLYIFSPFRKVVFDSLPIGNFLTKVTTKNISVNSDTLGRQAFYVCHQVLKNTLEIGFDCIKQRFGQEIPGVECC